MANESVTVTQTPNNVTVEKSSNTVTVEGSGTSNSSSSVTQSSNTVSITESPNTVSVSGGSSGGGLGSGGTISGSLGITQNLDVDGVLETDALTIDGVSLTETIQDVVGGMVSGNTENGISVTYDDSDGTLDFSTSSITDQNFTTADHDKLDGIEDGATADQTAAEIKILVESATDSNVFTDADHSKLSGIEDGAEVNVQSNWNATSGDALILNKPTIPSGSQIIDWTVDQFSTDIHVNNIPDIPYSAITGTPPAAQVIDWTTNQGYVDIHLGNIPTIPYSSLSGRPNIPSGNLILDWTTDRGAIDIHAGNISESSVAQHKAALFASPTFTGTVSGVNKAHVGLGNVTNESKATMFAGAALTGNSTATTQLTGNNSTRIATTAYVKGQNYISSVTASDVGLGNVTNESKATMFAGAALTGNSTATTQITGDNSTRIATTAYVKGQNYISSVTASDVGLGNVTNENKATMFTGAALTGNSTATTQLTGNNSTRIATTAFVKNQNYITSATASAVGLGNVTNESKATMFASPTFTGTPVAPTPTLSDDNTTIATTEYVKGQNYLIATSSAITSKAPLASPTFTGTVSGVSKAHVGLGNVTNESKATMFASPTFTGTPTAPTPTLSDNTTKLATTEYVKNQTIAYSSLSGKPTIPSGNQIIDWTLDQGSTVIHAGNYTDTNTTYTAGSGITLSGTTFSHADTSAQSSVSNSAGSVIQSINLDGLGHITQLTTANLDSRYYTETETNGFLNLKANLAGPTFTGVPSAPTAGSTTNTTQIATTAFVQTRVGEIIDSAPAALDTLNELAAALGDDANFSTTVTNSIALKAPIASPVFTGTPTAPNLTLTALSTYSGSDVTALMIKSNGVVGERSLGSAAFSATSDFAAASALGDYYTETETNQFLNLKANKASPTFTGTPVAPNLTLTNLSSYSGSDVTALMIKSNGVVGKRALGSAAFSATSAFLGATAKAADSELFDGIDSASFLRSNANDTYTGILTFGDGNSRIHGSDGHTLVRISSSKAYFGSTNRAAIVLASNSTTGVKANVSGTEHTVWHAGNDGDGSGLDADTLDGYQGSYYATTDGLALKLNKSGGTITGNVRFNDSIKAEFGSGADLQINHDGTQSLIDNGTGNLTIQNQTNDGDIIFKSDDGSGGITEYLRLDGGLGYTVSSKAIRIADGKALFLGDGDDLGIYHFASNNYIQNNLGDLIIQNDANDKDIVFKSDDGSGGITPYLTLDGSSTGLTVSAPQGMVFFDSIKAKFGNNDDLQIYHNGSHSYVINNTGDLEIINNTDDGDIKLVSDDGSGGTATYLRIDGGTTSIQAYKDLLIANDTAKIKLGASQDLQIFHDGSHSYISDAGSGDLRIQGSNNIVFYSYQTSEVMASMINNGGVELYFNNSKKFATTIDGIQLYGNGYLDMPDNGRIRMGASYDLAIYHDGNNSKLSHTGSGGLYIGANLFGIQNGAHTETYIDATNNGAVNLYYDNSKKLETSSTGISVTGNINLPDATGSGQGILFFGASNDLQVYHDGTNSRIENNTGNLILTNNTNDGDIIFKSDDGSGGVTPYLRLDGSHTQMLATKNLHFDDNVKALFGDYASPDLQIYHNGSNSYIDDASGTGSLYVNTNAFRVHSADGSDEMIKAVEGASGGVFLYHNNALKLSTTSTGISVAGSVGVTNIVTNRIVKFNGSILDDSVMVDDGTNVGIGTTSPSYLLDLESTATGLTHNLKLNKSSTTGDYAEIAFQLWSGAGTGLNTFGGSGTSRPSVVLRAINENGSQAAGAFAIATFTGGATNSTLTEKFRLTSAGNVGIGVTDPDAKLEIKGSGTGSGVALRVRNSSNTELLQVTDSGIVTVPQGYFYVSSGGGAYVQNALRVRGSLLNDQGTLSITGDVSFDSYTLFVDSAYDRVGVGSSSPSYKLDVSGGIRAGGKVTYHKSAASLTTTGYAVAGLTSSPNGNGASAGFTFTCFGHTGDYQRIVYSCYNTTGTWNTQKVIDEGTNDFDVAASANGSTITFTFKSRSGTKSYTPRVSVEAFGSSINNTYA